jgi:predicted Zn finger-like uncharacterized protein
MKFHCDRCKTRYSIADDRVRGKILKVRCKNCSSVITLKESGAVSTPRTPRHATSDGARSGGGRRSGRRRATSVSGSALQGAFEQALREPKPRGHSDSMADPPAMLEAEWYVSQDGEQFGPFGLSKAQEWVSLRQMDDELFCWSEGFDDWLPVEKVSHFRGLRGQVEPPRARSHSGMFAMPGDAGGALESGEMPMAAQREATPVPLFAATLAQVVAENQEKERGHSGRRNGSSVSSLGLPSSRPPTGPGAGGESIFASAIAAVRAQPQPERAGETMDDPSHDLEIGEASRVVKLPMLARDMGNAGPMAAPGLPGVAGTSPLGRGTGSLDPPTGALAGLPVIQGGTAADAPRPEILQPRRRRTNMAMPIAIGSSVVVGVVTVLLYVALAGEDESERLRRGQVGGKGGLAYQYEDPDDKDKEEEAKPQPSGGRRRAARKASTPRQVASAPAAAPTEGRMSYEEVDLSGGGGGQLDPDDVFEVVSANRIGVQMCYNSALKRDPLLKVRRADVSISVSPNGSVSNVSIPALSGTQLGMCLEKRIRAWRFPRGSETFRGQFPIVFQQS